MDVQIAAIRRFSRFYTQRIGVLHEGLLGSAFSLAEGRVLYEIGTTPDITAAALAGKLDLDRGYLSRILRGFTEAGIVARAASTRDGREMLLRLTADGARHFAEIDARSATEIGAMLTRLPPDRRARLMASLDAAEALLGDPPPAQLVIRAHKAGDLGWMVHRQAVLYSQEYGWDASFEALVAEIAGKFLTHHDPAREGCWLAERDGAILGSVMLVSESADVGKLRLLYVEPDARGGGIGAKLVAHCIEQARAAGYQRVKLWTNDVLVAARRIYQAAGFMLIEREPHRSFGHDLVGEVWELAL